jgi:hypothetical protein
MWIRGERLPTKAKYPRNAAIHHQKKGSNFYFSTLRAYGYRIEILFRKNTDGWVYWYIYMAIYNIYT